jgi:hypothetical protein
MRMLDVDWEVQQLEKIRRFFPSSNPSVLGRAEQPHSRDNTRDSRRQYANQRSDGAMNAASFESAANFEPRLRWPVFSHTTTQGPWFTLTIHRSLC